YGGTPATTIGSTTDASGGDAPITYSWRSSADGYTADVAGATLSTYTPPAGLTATTSYRRYAKDGSCSTTAAVSIGSWTVTVNPLPTVNPITGGATSTCVGSLTPAFTNTTPGGTWSIVDGTGSATVNAGVVTGVTAGNVTVVYAVTSGSCSSTATIPLIINPNHPAPTAATPSRPTCSAGASVELSGLPASGNLLQNDGTTITTIAFTSSTHTVTGLVPGTYRFAVDNGCTITYSAPVVVVANTYSGGTWTYGAPTSDDYIDFASDYTVAADVTYCSVRVSNNAIVTVDGKKTLTVTNGVHVVAGSQLIFEDSSSLMQTTTNKTINTGTIKYKRKSTKIRQADYVYWSTPVYNMTLGAVSPLTDPTKMYAHNGSGWIYKPGSTIMVEGKGYIIRGPEGTSNTVRNDFEATFTGTPINGSITSEVMTGNKFYLIGNPYPSALSADELISNNSNLTGTLYFWTHNVPVVLGGAYQYGADDYAVYNLSGGTGVGTPAGSGTIPSSGNNNSAPTGFIGAGQGFFAGIKTTGTISFTNDMRTGGLDINGLPLNGQFYKPGKNSKGTLLEKHRIWLNMTNTEGAFKQLLVAYVQGASNAYDDRYDGESFDANKYVDFYSINENTKLAIQGRGLPFADTDTVPLGYRSAIAGDFTISINNVDGNMTTQKIYIEDKSTGKIHDLTESNYTFTTAIGTFTDRLVLRYTNKSLGTGDFENIEKGITVSVKDKAVKVVSSNEAIQDVTIFDVAGKLLYTKKKAGTSELVISNLQSSNQVLLVDITLENGYKTTRKIIFQ
ncbi:T9SS sorting signal type C domain-containing protein, partial [Flavobacterium sp. 245]|uniref:T9SS sorting signal type C domain-containing protein n=1 Tax=Flavobacterium sp. 245 TaxID=2512115 RepID=UPI00105C363B